MKRLDAKLLAPIFSKCLTDIGVDQTSINHVVTSLLQTSLRGVDSHGIQLFPHYVRAVKARRINPTPKISVQETGSSVAIVDADHAFGHHAGAHAIDYAVQLASATGAGIVSVRNSTHFGAASYFALRAAERGMIGFSFTNADSLVKAFNGSSAFFGTNPVCFSAPLATEEPFCLDMATSQVSWNKLKVSLANGLAIPEDWAFDKNGMPVVDPALACSLNPAGGYKGFGLGMMVEILCAMLSGGPAATEILAMYSAPIEARREISHFFMVIDIQRFLDVEVFKQRLQGMVNALRAMPAMTDSVMAPGDPEKKTFAERSVAGIPVSAAIFDSLMQVSDEFNRAVIQ